eukprot:72663-Prymnesium_polylepis.1
MGRGRRNRPFMSTPFMNAFTFSGSRVGDSYVEPWLATWRPLATGWRPTGDRLATDWRPTGDQ